MRIDCPFWVLLGLGVFWGTGCRCGPSEDQLLKPSAGASSQPALAASVPGGTPSCGSRPDWAGALPQGVQLELLYMAQTDKGPRGTGYRLYQDETLETYDDIALLPDETGRKVLQHVEGQWKKRGKVDPASAAALRATVLSLEPKALQGAQPDTQGNRSARTVLSTRHEGALWVQCYHGEQAPGPTAELETQVQKLVNHLVKPAASSGR